MTDAEYLALYRLIRPYVTWSLGRKTRFTSSERGKITKAHSALVQAQRMGLVVTPVYRRSGESKRAYKRRLRNVRMQTNDLGSPLGRAVTVAAAVEPDPTTGVPEQEIQLVDGGTRVEVVTPRTGLRQWTIGIDWGRMLDDVDRVAYLEEVFEEAEVHGAIEIGIGGLRGNFIFADERFADVEGLIDFFDWAMGEYAALARFVPTLIAVG